MKKAEFEESIKDSPEKSYKYAKECKAPFHLGEPAIATDPEYSFFYSRYILCAPFRLGERVIATHAECACLYAEEVLKGRFEMGEEAISKNACWANVYAQEVLKAPWPMGEKAILTRPDVIYSYTMKLKRHEGWPEADDIMLADDFYGPLWAENFVFGYKENVANFQRNLTKEYLRLRSAENKDGAHSLLQ